MCEIMSFMNSTHKINSSKDLKYCGNPNYNFFSIIGILNPTVARPSCRYTTHGVRQLYDAVMILV